MPVTKMQLVLFIAYFIGIFSVDAFENLSRRPTTVLTQSSTYRFNIASIANDGDVQTTEPKCAITVLNPPKAWLQVDFGQPYRINNVKIYPRREGDGPSAWKQYRFRQFYLDASNSSATQTTTSQRTRCYTDNTTAPDLPPNITDIPCKQTARYVIVETTYDAPEDEITGGAILEICEIEVYEAITLADLTRFYQEMQTDLIPVITLANKTIVILY
ncbi:uncharacterized protein [Magallana gigas]|uniref:uncharacterized protein isoform X2 n=1 Tax=Magallana gigas TaxID=29159 RepID=UPI00333F5B9C